MTKKTGTDIDHLKCLYYAEAGIAKALWYLKNDGIRWRTTGYTENFGEGNYKIIVENGNSPTEVLITSQGKVRDSVRTIQVRYWTYPPACNYALYSLQTTRALSGSRVSGNLFADNNVVIDGRVENGYVMVTSGHTVSGGGSYTTAPPPVPPPAFPALETSYYNSRLATAQTMTRQSKIYSGNHSLFGGTTYVNGNVSISGMIIGPGEIVATDNITMESFGVVSGDVKLVAGQKIDFKQYASVGDNSVLYAADQVIIESGVYNDHRLSLLSPKDIILYDNSYTAGIICGGSVSLGSGATFAGSVVAGSFGAENTLGHGVRAYYYFSQFPEVPAPGMSLTYDLVPGSWKEL